MCTGIFLFEPRPVLALNFDYDRTFRLTLENDSAFCMRIRWREMLWLQKDSVLCVAASDYYDPEDYIRDYDEFKDYIRSKS